MQLAGYMPDDFLLVDTHAAERVRGGIRGQARREIARVLRARRSCR
jgi:hypothetical protein